MLSVSVALQCAYTSAVCPRSERRGGITALSFGGFPLSESCCPICEIACQFALFLVRTSELPLVAYGDRVPGAMTLAQSVRVSPAAALRSATIPLASLP